MRCLRRKFFFIFQDITRVFHQFISYITFIGFSAYLYTMYHLILANTIYIPRQNVPRCIDYKSKKQ